MDRWRGVRAIAAVAGPPAAAAVLGNAYIGRDALRWFGRLRRPRLHIPMPAFVVVGGVFYLQVGTVLNRAHRKGDRVVRDRALLVLAGNEHWNAAFFGRRSPRNGFVGVLVYLVPLLALQKSVSSDRPSMLALTPYTLWVLLYDVPWTYALWRLNRNSPAEPVRPRHARTM